MLYATLCTTNGHEPWGATVSFETNGDTWTTTLKKKYAHFQNLIVIPKAVIVYKKTDLEVILKVNVIVLKDEADKAEVSFTIDWLRVVSPTSTSDFSEKADILEQLRLYL